LQEQIWTHDKSAGEPIWTTERSEVARRARCRMHLVNAPEGRAPGMARVNSTRKIVQPQQILKEECDTHSRKHIGNSQRNRLLPICKNRFVTFS